MSGKRIFSLIKGGSRPTPLAVEQVSQYGSNARRLAMCSNADARACISQALAERHAMLPLGLVTIGTRKRLTIAVPIGERIEAQQAAVFITGHEVCAVEMNEAIVREAIFIAYCGDEKSIERSIDHLRRSEESVVVHKPTSVPFRPIKGDVGIFLADLVEYALAQDASDVHLVPLGEGLFVRLRIRGELRSHMEPVCTPAQAAQLVSRVKVLAGLDVTKRDQPFDGAFSLPLANSAAFVRVSTMPTIHGEKVVLRLVRSAPTIPLKDMGYSPEMVGHFEEIMNVPSGLVVLSGPTGSGKTTTLYTLARDLHARGMNVITLEDPVEAVVSGLSQTSIVPHKGFGFVEGLKSIVRQDPDVILLGEVRDREIAELTLQAALAGRLVLTTIHAGSALEVVMRLSTFGIDSFLLAQALRLVVWQRLVPTLCRSCKVLDLGATNLEGVNIFRAVGCERCDYSGYAERVPVAEALRLDARARERFARAGVSSEAYEALQSCVNPKAFQEAKKLYLVGDLTQEQLRAFSSS